MKHASIITLLLLVVALVAAGAQNPPTADQSAAPREVVTPPTFIPGPAPEYTEEARKAQIQGMVLLSVVVRADGTVGDVKVKRSLKKDLDERAIAAVKLWRFSPATKNGKPVSVQINVEVNFHLYGPSVAPTLLPEFPDSKIESLSDGRQVLTNAPLGIRIVIPVGWSQVGYHNGDSRPATMTLHRTQTLASVEVMRQTLEASPDLYRKVLQSKMEKVFQNVDVIGGEVIDKPDRSGARLMISGTRKDIKMQCIVDIYTHENQHHVLSACAPDEVFAKYRQDLDAMLNSVVFTEFATSSVGQNK